MSKYVLAIDAGTTGVTVLLFDESASITRRAYSEFAQHYPQPGWVEHDADEIWSVTERLLGEVTDAVGADAIACIGITDAGAGVAITFCRIRITGAGPVAFQELVK